MAGALQLIIACAGIFGSFSYFAVLQEDVYKTDYDGEKFQFTFLALLVERGINALVAAVGVAAFGGSGLKIPYMDISLSGMSQMFAMAGSNEALRYVSYPTQVLGKSCKMVPVMAGGLLLGGKSYTLFEYLQVALITGGVVVFNFGGKKKGGGAADSAYGLVLIGLSLIMDMVCRAHAHMHTCTCTHAHMRMRLWACTCAWHTDPRPAHPCSHPCYHPCYHEPRPRPSPRPRPAPHPRPALPR